MAPVKRSFVLLCHHQPLFFCFLKNRQRICKNCFSFSTILFSITFGRRKSRLLVHHMMLHHTGYNLLLCDTVRLYQFTLTRKKKKEKKIIQFRGGEKKGTCLSDGERPHWAHDMQKVGALGASFSFQVGLMCQYYLKRSLRPWSSTSYLAETLTEVHGRSNDLTMQTCRTLQETGVF